MWWVLAIFLLLVPTAAYPCTDGTDCFCDKEPMASDARQLLCADWEEITYTDGKGSGAQGLTGPGSGGTACVEGNVSANCANNETAPLYGPQYDVGPSSFAGARSANWIWRKKFGGTAGSCGLTIGNPAVPTWGVTKTTGAEGNITGEWSDGDIWQSNTPACVDFIRAGEWEDEVGTDLAPLLPDGSRGTFGNQTLGLRVAGTGPGIGEISGAEAWGNVEEIGITMLVAYSTNIESSTIWNGPWKHDEFGTSDNTMFMMDNNTGGLPVECNEHDTSPFCSSFFMDAGEAGCNAALAAPEWDPREGEFYCTATGFYQFPNDNVGANYIRDTNWPDLNKWACVRLHVRGIAASGKTLGVTKTADFGDGNGDIMLIDYDGLDNAITTDGAALMSHISWNAFSNVRQSNDITTGGVVTSVRRYVENAYIRGGTTAQCAGGLCEPITCAEAEFASTITDTVLTVAPTLFSSTITAGDNATADTFTVGNTGVAGTIDYTVVESPAVAWLSVAPGTGSASGPAEDTITITYATTGLTAAGSPYTTDIVVADDGSTPTPVPASRTIPITVIVNADTFTITGVTPTPSSGLSPINGIDLAFTVAGTASGDVLLEADCDNNGSYEVSFNDAAAPFTFVDACSVAGAPGAHPIPVRATRETVVDTDSTSVTITALTFSITSVTPTPSNGISPLLGIDLTFTVDGTAAGDVLLEADCNNNGIYEVSFNDVAAPFTFVDACNVAGVPGAYTIPVQATREAVVDTDSTSVTIDVTTFAITSVILTPNSGLSPVPDIDITLTVIGTAVGNVLIEADCDNNGSYEVNFDDAAAPWTFVDACTVVGAPGDHTIPVRATRSAVVDTDSAVVTVTNPAGTARCATLGPTGTIRGTPPSERCNR